MILGADRCQKMLYPSCWRGLIRREQSLLYCIRFFLFHKNWFSTFPRKQLFVTKTSNLYNKGLTQECSLKGDFNENMNYKKWKHNTIPYQMTNRIPKKQNYSLSLNLQLLLWILITLFGAKLSTNTPHRTRNLTSISFNFPNLIRTGWSTLNLNGIFPVVCCCSSNVVIIPAASWVWPDISTSITVVFSCPW